MATRVQAPGGAAPQSDTLVSSRVLARSPLTSDEFEVDGLEARSPTPTDFSNSAFQENFAGVPVSSGAMPLVQPKLLVGPPNDKYEQEADRVADQVMGMPEPKATESKKHNSETQVKQVSSGFPQVRSDLERHLIANRASGVSLSDDVRSFMEPRFNADFSQVQVHTDSKAIQMNRDLGAQAFTHKQDIYFGSGASPAKNALTAHELMHVIQQTGKLQRQPISTNKNDIPITTQPQARTLEASTGSVSWIDPASPAGSGRLGVSDPIPPATISENFITGSSGFRFSNYLRGYVKTNDSVTIASAGLHRKSGIYTSPSLFGLGSSRFTTLNSQRIITRGNIQGVRFTQTTGARTTSAGHAAGVGGGILGGGILGGLLGGMKKGLLGGPKGMIAGGILGAGAGFLVGRATANKIPQTNFPPIWTEIQLTIMADGTHDFQILRHSLFPSNSFYGIPFSSPIGATDPTSLIRTGTYKALARQQLAWQNSGWGSGNPWGMNRPTIKP